GADLIARKGVQIISTEDTIYITSPNEINLTAGGSQVKLNGLGIFPTTGGKFESKAGQHQFISGENVTPNIPIIPKVGIYNLRFEVRDKETNEILTNTAYVLIDKLGHTHYGVTDDKGYTSVIYSDKKEGYALHVLSNQIEDFSSKDENDGQI